ncbi:MAG: EAL domain-containing protein [Thalassolituus sp.]
MNALASAADGSYQPSEGWKRVEEESRRAGTSRGGRFGASDIRLETILERTMRVFLTTRQESFAADVEGALLQIARILKASGAALFVTGDPSVRRPQLLVTVSFQQNKIDDVLFQQYLSENNSGVVPRCTDEKDENALEKSIRESLAGDRVTQIPLLDNHGVIGHFFLTFEADRAPLSSRKMAQLGTFAQLCCLMQERLHVMATLEDRERLLRQTERLAKIGSWYDDVENDRITITPQAAAIFEQEGAVDVVSLGNYFEYVHPDDIERVARTLTESMNQCKPSDMIYRIVPPSGEEKVIHGRAEVIVNAEGRVVARVGSIQDITEQQAREHRLRLAMTVFEFSMEGVVITNADREIEAVNPAFSTITGYAEREVMGEKISLLRSNRHNEDFYRRMNSQLKERGYWRGEIWNKRKNGETYPQWLTITEVRDEQKRITHYVGVFSDMSRIKEHEQQVQHLSNYDSLTNLPNRHLLLSRLEGAINDATTNNRKVAVIAIDLDHFKHINDSLGHPAGDRLLQEFAKRMRQRLRDSDTVARQGGDDFVVVLENVANDQQVANVARIILDLLKTPFDVGVGKDLHIGASLGITLFPEHGADVTQLLSNADVAMYQAKQQGRNSFRFYSNEMTQAVSDRLELGNQLRVALQQDDELRLYYQPQVCITSGKVTGVEALIRWHTEDDEVIPPGRFLPVAEDNGLMPDLDSYVLQKACRQVARWQAEGLERIVVAVNITQPTFMAGGLVARLSGLLKETGIDPSWLELEITEGALLEPSPQVLNTIAGLKELGVALAVDDFGTGYSSLAYLHRYRVDKLKIDRGFVQSADVDEEGKVITRTIIQMAKGLGLAVLAEGVETEGQLEFLRENGCETYQGFYFSRPVPVDELRLA